MSMHFGAPTFLMKRPAGKQAPRLAACVTTSGARMSKLRPETLHPGQLRPEKPNLSCRPFLHRARHPDRCFGPHETETGACLDATLCCPYHTSNAALHTVRPAVDEAVDRHCFGAEGCCGPECGERECFDLPHPCDTEKHIQMNRKECTQCVAGAGCCGGTAGCCIGVTCASCVAFCPGPVAGCTACLHRTLSACIHAIPCIGPALVAVCPHAGSFSCCGCAVPQVAFPPPRRPKCRGRRRAETKARTMDLQEGPWQSRCQRATPDELRKGRVQARTSL